jgi:hypothetical protein
MRVWMPLGAGRPPVTRNTIPTSLGRRRLLQTGALAACGAAARPAAALSAPSGSVVLTISGKLRNFNADRQALFDMAMLAALGQTTLVTQTPWFTQPRSFTGPLLRDVLARCGAEGTSLRMSALDDFRADVPVSDALKYDVIVAHLLDNKPMLVREKGPLFIMYPFQSKSELRTSVYYARAVWQLHKIEVL